MPAKKALFALSLLLILSAVTYAMPGIPVDIPGTNVHFFLYRYETGTPPYGEVATIWARLSGVFNTWAEKEGKNPALLTPNHVTIAQTTEGHLGIYLKGTLIVVVDEYHAKANHATKDQLAQMWARNLEEGVAVFAEQNALK